MKNILTAFLIVIVCAGVAAAQELQDEEILKRMNVPEATMEKLRELDRETMALVRTAGAEQKLLQARLERLLLERDPDMKQIEALLRESLELKLNVELKNIERIREMQRLLGEEQWMDYLRYRNEYRQRTSSRTGEIPSGNEPAETRESRSSRNSGESSNAGSSGGSGSSRSSGASGRR
ncbi:hypothetical protein [Marispirochaeta sp.]|jgi:uncharacterized membrane protein YgcG|uniref:hypothetical protein n=1 Tax=Marispirochaeta sp. TaxID=2038653 RepID=UPI0029C6C077|nr:hypothetical protein [Marispirochaeta sp.]